MEKENPWFNIIEFARLFDIKVAEIEAQGKDGKTGFYKADSLISLRQIIRDELKALKQVLLSTLSERETYYVLFPLIAMSDEKIRSLPYIEEHKWSPLQKELFKVDNAGELFYQMIDELMRKGNTLNLIFEVFYFCLKNGFKGKFLLEKHRVKEYIEKLETMIPITETPLSGPGQREMQKIKPYTFPWLYYVLPGLALATFYLALKYLV